jgi:hypothetical protein
MNSGFIRETYLNVEIISLSDIKGPYLFPPDKYNDRKTGKDRRAAGIKGITGQAWYLYIIAL